MVIKWHVPPIAEIHGDYLATMARDIERERSLPEDNVRLLEWACQECYRTKFEKVSELMRAEENTHSLTIKEQIEISPKVLKSIGAYLCKQKCTVQGNPPAALVENAALFRGGLLFWKEWLDEATRYGDQLSEEQCEPHSWK